MQHFRLDRIPDNLLRDPLAFLVADHVRQRKICGALGALVQATDATGSAAVVTAIVAYLSRDLPVHIADEELDLFPAMLRANGLDEDAKKLIDDLESDHAQELSLARSLITVLRERIPPFAHGNPVGRLASLSEIFAERILGHLTIEDQTLIPLARKRLSGADLERIGRAMAARRQIDYPE